MTHQLIAALIILILVTLLIPFGEAEKYVCTSRLSSCSCQLANGQVIDLSPLQAYGGGPAFSLAAADGYTYQYNPCGAYRCGEEADSAVCQEKMLIIVQYTDFGIQSKAEFVNDPSTGQLQLSYRSRDASKSSMVNLLCDPSAAVPVFATQGAQQADSQLTADLRSRHACPFTPDYGGPSFGDILLIACLSLAIVYLLAGVLFNKFVRHQTGLRQLLPNADFWASLPGLVADGAAFVCESARRLVCAERGGYTDIK